MPYFGDQVGEAIVVSAGMIHYGPHVFVIHHGNEFVWLAEVTALASEFHSVARFGGYANVRVHIDYRKPGTLDVRLVKRGACFYVRIPHVVTAGFGPRLKLGILVDGGGRKRGPCVCGSAEDEIQRVKPPATVYHDSPNRAQTCE